MDQDTLKTLTSFLPITTPFISALVETRIKPILQDFFKSHDTDKAILAEVGVSKFTEYLSRAYERYSTLTIMIFPNRPKELRKLYVPITLVGQYTIGRMRIEESSLKVSFSSDIKVDTYSDDFLPYYRKVLVTDTAGMGKSTLLKFLFLECVDKNKGIPVLIELRRITKDNTILKLICDDLNGIDANIDENFILKLIRRGDFIFLFDGFDEIPLANREFVTLHLQDFIAKTSSNYFVITSRPDPSITSFGDFTGFNIKPLDRQAAYDLIERYDEGGGRASKLIHDLESGERLDEVEEFLSNPLLISLLYAYYEYTPHLQFKKHLFYRQVYDALFYRHDITKPGGYVREKRTQLRHDDFEKLVRALAYATFKSGEVEYDIDTILSRMAEIKTVCPNIGFKESELLEDLVSNVPLFVRDGIYYKWQHKSLQEYFAARYLLKIGNEHLSKLLNRIYRSNDLDRCYNVLSLFYDMDADLFRKTLGCELANDFIGYYSERFRTIDRNLIPEDAIHHRKELSFLATVFFLVTAKSRKAQRLERSDKRKLRWDKTSTSSIIENALNKSGINANQLKFCFIEIDHKYLQSAILFSKPAYTVFSILAERQDRLVKKMVNNDSIESLKDALHIFETQEGIFFNTSEDSVSMLLSSSDQFLLTNIVLELSLKDYTFNCVLDLEECNRLLEQLQNNKQENNFLFDGW